MRLYTSVSRRVVMVAVILATWLTVVLFVTASTEEQSISQNGLGTGVDPTSKNLQFNVATLDDFFRDYLDLFCDLYIIDPDSTLENSTRFSDKTFRKISAKLYRDKSKYGHLPEYWELTAFIKPDPTKMDISNFSQRTCPDRSKLEKALVLCDVHQLVRAIL